MSDWWRKKRSDVVAYAISGTIIGVLVRLHFGAIYPDPIHDVFVPVTFFVIGVAVGAMR